MLIIHTADIHIGVENYSRPDPKTRTSSRLQDFLRSLDELVDYSIDNEADLVLICGDVYKSRNPTQTHQREFVKRISRLAREGIKVFLLAGNHDSPNVPGPATTLDIFPTLDIENVQIANELNTQIVQTRNGSIQIISLPWIRKGDFMSLEKYNQLSNEKFNSAIEEKLIEDLDKEIANLDSSMPSILASHVSVDLAKTSSEKSMTLGKDYLLPTNFLANPKLDYVALGHIHRHQILNDDPPVVYSGSLERIDFGEEKDSKGFCVIDISTSPDKKNRLNSYKFVEVNARRFKTIQIKIEENDGSPNEKIVAEIEKHDIYETIAQVIIEVSSSRYSEISDRKIRDSLSEANFVAAIRKNVITESKNRLGKELHESIPAIEALETYLKERNIGEEKIRLLLEKGQNLISENPPQ
ncbi:MAG: exonuclease SbcCD subunit D [Chloroflexota bacterium]|jgi:exonuclease SbcD|nr:exonuclease SbcCD subunit D [Chloroflexota bacterium]|tara:strand:- start:41001 stop:42236 length:1236 start_codon:yes stop_codon:yes gene_type:complete